MTEAALPVEDIVAIDVAIDTAARPRAPKKPRMPRSETRIADEAAFVLHSYPYKETSLIVDALTRHHGRVALVARGAKRPRSALRGALLAFQPLTISWVQARARAVSVSQGGAELRTLTRAEWQGGLRPLSGDALMSGFYLNELIQKLLARDDPHEHLFDAYVEALVALSGERPERPARQVLRQFELVLLREAGYAVLTAHAADGNDIDPSRRYRYLPERGPVLAERDDDAETVVDGRTLLALDRDDYGDPATLAQAKRLLRHLLSHHLSGQMLHTRRLLLDLQALEESSPR